MSTTKMKSEIFFPEAKNKSFYTLFWSTYSNNVRNIPSKTKPMQISQHNESKKWFGELKKALFLKGH